MPGFVTAIADDNDRRAYEILRPANVLPEIWTGLRLPEQSSGLRATVVEAVADGMQAARGIDCYLRPDLLGLA